MHCIQMTSSLFSSVQKEVEEALVYDPNVGTISDDVADGMKADAEKPAPKVDIDFVPYYQRVSISGEDNTGVSF